MSDLAGSRGREYAITLQEKFELYLLGLIFTVLALAVQTAKFEANLVANGLELAGWLGLLVSGIVGLWRMEWVPVAHQYQAQKLDLERDVLRFEAAAETGVTHHPVVDQAEPATIESLIANRKASITRVETSLLPIEKAIRLKYVVHKWTFVAGLGLLICARGYAPLEEIAKHLLQSRG